MLTMILLGGKMMYPLLAASIISCTIIFERWVVFRKCDIDRHALRKKVFDLLKHGQLRQAIQLCGNTPGPVAFVLYGGLKRYEHLMEHAGKPDADGVIMTRAAIVAEVTKTMGDVAPHAMEILENRLNYLSLIGTIAPLLGMTGTVTGMINSFSSIADAGQIEATKVASGISEALITTAAGLIISIPAFIAYNIFARRIEHFLLDIEDTAGKLSEFLLSGAE